MPEKKTFLTDVNGYTLIELITVMGIMLLLIVMGGNYIVNGFKSTKFESEQSTAIKNARDAMETMVKEIRGANTSMMGSYCLASTSAQNLIFYSDIDNDYQYEMIRYYLDSTINELKRVETEPGTANNYLQPGATTTIARYVNNQVEPIFQYYNVNFASTSAINYIRLINIRLKINVTPWRAPADTYVESSVQLRNLKDN